MTAYVQFDCPHEDCLTEKAGFTCVHFIQFKPNSQEYILLLQCGVCGNGVLAKYRGTNVPQWVQNQSGNVALLEMWPKREPINVPQYLPPNVASFYTQGMDSLRRKNFDAAGTMFRKSLDVGLKAIDPTGKGTLEKRIDHLPDTLGITPALKEWAHQIRHLGNDAAHEDEPFTADEAKVLQSFTELFLTYTFTMPRMLAERRKPPDEGASE